MSVEPLVERAVSEQRAGHGAVAERLYRAALTECADHPEANHNLAILLLQAGDASSALDHFRTALENDSKRELYWLSFARALLLTGKPSEAVAVICEGKSHIALGSAAESLLLQSKAMVAATQGEAPPSFVVTALAERQASALARHGDLSGAITRLQNALSEQRPDADRLLLQLGNLLTETGRIPDAIAAYEQAIHLNPQFADAHYHLGSVLSENGSIHDGFEHLMRRAALVHSRDVSPPQNELPHKIKHDLEQRAYLIGKGILDSKTESLPFHIADAERLPGKAINQQAVTPDLKARWDKACPQFLVFDDFLVPDALAKLRNFCAESTVWKRVYDAGYIGATPADGFACPLLAQIAEEVREVFADILTADRFRYLGAFKYDSSLSTGTNTHADFSSVNVNLYIAPDDSNLEPETGGMVIWDSFAISEAELRLYNSDENALRSHLKSVGAKPTHIPHRANRAIIFRSSLFHKTDECSFREGYLNKRINVSLLYGDFSA